MVVDASGMRVYTVSEVAARLERARRSGSRGAIAPKDEARLEHSIRFLTGNEPA